MKKPKYPRGIFYVQPTIDEMCAMVGLSKEETKEVLNMSNTKEPIKIKVIEEIEIKRFYLQDTIKEKCPLCGGKAEHDGGQQYISYPMPNSFESIPFLCADCDEWSDIEYKFEMEITLTKKEDA